MDKKVEFLNLKKNNLIKKHLQILKNTKPLILQL